MPGAHVGEERVGVGRAFDVYMRQAASAGHHHHLVGERARERRHLRGARRGAADARRERPGEQPHCRGEGVEDAQAEDAVEREENLHAERRGGVFRRRVVTLRARTLRRRRSREGARRGEGDGQPDPEREPECPDHGKRHEGEHPEPHEARGERAQCGLQRVRAAVAQEHCVVEAHPDEQERRQQVEEVGRFAAMPQHRADGGERGERRRDHGERRTSVDGCEEREDDGERDGEPQTGLHRPARQHGCELLARLPEARAFRKWRLWGRRRRHHERVAAHERSGKGGGKGVLFPFHGLGRGAQRREPEEFGVRRALLGVELLNVGRRCAPCGQRRKDRR